MTRTNGFLLRRLAFTCLPLAGLLALGLAAGLLAGSSSISFERAVDVLLGLRPDDAAAGAVIWKLRLPRTLLAAMAGGALSLCGLVFQTLLRNPLADPYILGVSGGGALGVVIGVLLGLPAFWGAGAPAFCGAMAAFAISVLVSRKKGGAASLVLSGVMVNAFCSAAILFFLATAGDRDLRTALVWLMGDVSAATLQSLALPAACLAPAALIPFLLSHKLNLLLLGNEEAENLGVRVRPVRGALVASTVFMTSVIVGQTGLLGFVGLVCPHIMRLAAGCDHRILAPASMLFGAAFLVYCDVGSRLLSFQGVLPVGVLTAMVGAPVFLFLLRRSNA